MVRFIKIYWLILFFSLLPSRFALAQGYDPNRFEKQVIVPACNDPMQLEVLADGQVFFIERNGTLKRYDPATQKVMVLGQVPTDNVWEVGMLGFALDRDFARSQALFLFFAPLEKKNYLRLARFALNEGKLDLFSQKILLEYSLEDDKLTHQGGGLFMAANGDLILGTGDNTPPIPELQIDEREGRKRWDAQRTSANSMELRGKILRIHPLPDGSYTIPPGNLFPDGKAGRPEIFAMGVRNGFRQFVDANTGFIYWGDVGQNITEEINVGPNGYDEINQARSAGNFGWPYFTGNNEAYRDFDFTTRQAGPLFDVRKPRNDSPNNTGLKDLPLPQPAFIWYPSTESTDFPMLGSGGRSAMVGPVFRADKTVTSPFKLPNYFDHTLFIHDWMRNWIMAVRLDANEQIIRIEPFLPQMRFRKPLELKLAPDHTLYLIETGDKWTGNTDSQIVRLIYRRGNRPPKTILSASNNAGKQPLRVQFDARKSTDPDGDALRYRWTFGEGGRLGISTKEAPVFTFTRPGAHPVTLTVTDANGLKHTQTTTIMVGNARPVVRLAAPLNGSFYEPGQPVAYQAVVTDSEDGSSEQGQIPSTRVLVETRLATRLSEQTTVHPGLAKMRATTCFGCHTITEKSVGPSYQAVAQRYAADKTAGERLAQKILKGGIGVWGTEVPMPPHPQHTLEETRQMVDWILSLSSNTGQLTTSGLAGTLTAPVVKTDKRAIPPVFIVKASYTDNGAGKVPALKGEAVAVLHPRRKRATTFDAAEGVEVVDVFEGGEGNVARLTDGGWFRFDALNLTGVRQMTFRTALLTPESIVLEVHLNAPKGLLMGSMTLASSPKNGPQFSEWPLPIPSITGTQIVYIVARRAPPPPSERDSAVRLVDVNWIVFESSPPVIPHSSKH